MDKSEGYPPGNIFLILEGLSGDFTVTTEKYSE